MLRFLLLGGVATSGFALAVACWRPHSLRLLDAPTYAALIATLVAACTCGAWAAVTGWRARRDTSWELRAGFCAFVLTAAVYITFAPAFKALFLVLHLGVACGAYGAFLLVARRVRAWIPAKARRALDFGTFSVCVAAVGIELALRVVPLVSSSPVFERTTTPQSQIDRYRLAPGEPHFGFPANSLGYPDAEPVRRPGRRFVVAIGDSFSQGVVPHAFHYTTVCEELLGDTDIANFGVTTIGPAEYLTILERDALPREPDAILIALFVGNDVHDSLRYREDHGPLRTIFDRTRCQLVQVPRRLLRLRAERGRTGADAGRVQGEFDGREIVERGALEAHYPWLADHRLERPTFSREAYLDAEYTRIVAACDPNDLDAYDALFAILARILERARPTPVWFVLIPDEFQVEDALWRDALDGRADPRRFRRTQPQDLIGSWLEARRVPHLDLLPRLRAIAPLEDGDRHLYHRRDTHFNARGNRASAEALADFLRER